jgi:hypothetical protein
MIDMAPAEVEDEDEEVPEVITMVENPDLAKLVGNIETFLDKRAPDWVQLAVRKSPLRQSIDIFGKVEEWAKHVETSRSSTAMVSDSIRILIKAMDVSQGALCLSNFMKALIAMSHLESSRKMQPSILEHLLAVNSKALPPNPEQLRHLNRDEIAVAYLIRGMTPETKAMSWQKSAQVAYYRGVTHRGIKITPKELRSSYEMYALGLLLDPALLLLPAFAWVSPSKYVSGTAIGAYMALKNSSNIQQVSAELKEGFPELYGRIHRLCSVYNQNGEALNKFLALPNYKTYLEYENKPDIEKLINQ